MQYVDDDMDDLFRRAAENYPLDTSGADWKKVLSMLEGESDGKTVSEKRSNGNGRLLWLLLLLPLGLVCNQLYTPGLFSDTGRLHTDPSTTKGKVNEIGASGLSDDSKIYKETNREKHEPLNIGTGLDEKGQKEDIQNSVAFVPQNGKGLSANKTPDSGQEFNRNQTNIWTSSSSQPFNGQIFTADANLNEQAGLQSRKYVKSIDYSGGIQETSFTLPAKSLSPLVITSGEKNKIIDFAKAKRFYFGLLGGIDATTIKLQKIENAGFSYGVLAGFQFNSRWSIETGAYMDRKYYYSDAKYFNSSKIYVPPNSSISDVSGDCKMIELPVSARYLFGIQKQSSWFGTVGLTSYILTQENYTYDYYYGTVGPYPHQKQYNNSSTHVFSNISLSAGYNHTLGKFADVRIEPYFKLPISGLGVGSMPFLSMGLQVGVTKKF